MTAVVRNAGGGTAAASVLRFYLSTDLTLDASDFRLEAGRQVSPLAPDATDGGSTSVPLPTNRTGAQYLLVVADGDQTVAESNELNNLGARLIQIGSGG